MSGALNSVLGGSGGSILGSIGGIIGMEFGPIGSMIGEAIGNMLQQAVSGAVSQAADQLQQQHGMPPFLANMVKDTAHDHAQQNQANVPADVQQHAQDKYGSIIADMTNQMGAAIASAAAHKHKESGDSGAGGWLEAIAKAMGDCLGQQAADLVRLSNKMQGEMPSGSTGGGTGGPATGTTTNPNGGPSNTTTSKDDNTAQAAQFNQDMTQFQALSQQYSILQNTFSTAIKSLGEALQGMARKS